MNYHDRTDNDRILRIFMNVVPKIIIGVENIHDCTDLFVLSVTHGRDMDADIEEGD